MLERVAQHFVGVRRGSERKYRILAEAQRKGQTVGFDLLEQGKTYRQITEMTGISKSTVIRARRSSI